MPYAVPCPQCDQLAPVSPPGTPAYCPTCGHRSDASVSACDCPACDPERTQEIQVAAIRAAYELAQSTTPSEDRP
jgi:hypothetical protein